MEVAYYETKNFIRHEGNVVNLTEYRQKLARAAEETPDREPDQPDRVPILRPRRRHLAPLVADYCASGAVVVMTLTFVVKMLAVF